jgi:demethylmenaquinone methyltransferase/2-methoxy-6-polyprenyl-1,4-benzoquinol methylase
MSKNEILNDKIKPYSETENKTEQLTRLFNGISGVYDYFNDLVSFGFSRSWRKKAVKKLKKYKPEKILDLATGTADMCLVLSNIVNPKEIVGIDISEKMLEEAKVKVNKMKLNEKVTLLIGDSSDLKFENQSFDAVTISFGIRNFEKLSQSLREIHRVLNPMGILLIIEVNAPNTNFKRLFYKIYVGIVFGLAGIFLSKDKKAFKYLFKTMNEFPQGNDLISIIEEENFTKIKYKTLFPGVCSYYLFKKSSAK